MLSSHKPLTRSLHSDNCLTIHSGIHSDTLSGINQSINQFILLDQKNMVTTISDRTCNDHNVLMGTKGDPRSTKVPKGPTTVCTWMLLADISCILSGIHSNIHSDIHSNIHSDIHSSICSGILSGIISDMHSEWT